MAGAREEHICRPTQLGYPIFWRGSMGTLPIRVGTLPTHAQRELGPGGRLGEREAQARPCSKAKRVASMRVLTPSLW